MLLFIISRQQELTYKNEEESLDATLIDWIIINHHLGWRASEYSQSTQSRVGQDITGLSTAQSLSPLPAIVHSSLMDLGLPRERIIAVSRCSKGRKTKDTRVSWYLLFCRRHNINDPCLEDYSIDVVDTVLGCYIESLIQGNNILSSKTDI